MVMGTGEAVAVSMLGALALMAIVILCARLSDATHQAETWKAISHTQNSIIESSRPCRL